MNKMSWERSHGVTEVWFQQEIGKAFWETPLEWDVINSQTGMAVRSLFIAILIEFERKIEIQSSAKLREDSERAQSIKNAWKEKAATPPTKTKCPCPHLTCPLFAETAWPQLLNWVNWASLRREDTHGFRRNDLAWLKTSMLCVRTEPRAVDRKHEPFGWVWNWRPAGRFLLFVAGAVGLSLHGNERNNFKAFVKADFDKGRCCFDTLLVPWLFY